MMITATSLKKQKQEIMSTASETDREYPLAILINRSSASASELMSGTLQDLDRAVLVGERTYGKGIGQQGFQISGFTSKSLLGESATFYLLSLTTMRYFFPSGKNPHGVGVSPDRDVQPWTASGDRSPRTSWLRTPTGWPRRSPTRCFISSTAAD